MKGDKIKYKKGFKYQLCETSSVMTPIVGYDIKTEYIDLAPDGTLTMREGYAWDGASGPTYDSKCSMRGSLYHDGFYQLLRLELISHKCRKLVDQFFHDICVEDKMYPSRAAVWLKMVRIFGIYAADPEAEHPVIEAP